MRKKVLSLSLVTIVGLSIFAGALTGCTNANKREELELKTTELIQEDNVVTEVEDSTEVQKEVSSEPLDFEVVDATWENPANLAEWVETRFYLSDTIPVYYRVTGLIRGDEAQKLVDEHNAKMESESIKQVDALMSDELEYCVITYEVRFPEDYPDEGKGLGTFARQVLDLYVCGSSYDIEEVIGTTEVKDISEEPDEFLSGTNTFTEGKAAFVMEKGCTDYVLWAEYYYAYAEDKITSQNRYIYCE